MQIQTHDMADHVKSVFGRSTRRLEMISENLANARTPGFRSGEVLTSPTDSFRHVYGHRLIADGERDATDLSQGSLQMTDRPLDFALSGDGFFVVGHGDQEYLTRNGHFDVNADGELVSAAGHRVLGDDGAPIQVPGGASLNSIHVSEDGTLQADKQVIGQLRIERVTSEQHLRRVGTTLFTAPRQAREPAPDTRVVGRTLEGSNTVVFQELSNLMLLTRSVEALQRAQASEAQAQSKMIDALSA